MKTNKKLSGYIFLVIFCFACTLSAQGYLKRPEVGENNKKFISAKIAGKNISKKSNISEAQIEDLCNKIADGNCVALEAAFCALIGADGADSEWISECVGNAISVMPDCFFKILCYVREEYVKSGKEKDYIERFRYIGLHLGPEYVDELKKREIEENKRLNIIKKIKIAENDENAKLVKELLIASFEESIRELKLER
jgi:hypothetical protein